MIPNLFEYVVAESGGPRNELSERNGYETNTFLLNCGDLWTVLMLQTLLYPVFVILSEIRCKRVAQFFRKIAVSYKWNLYIRFWIEAYLEIGMASLL